jgi:hypothetical protein
MSLAFSRRLAIVLGIVTPLAETIRRWHQLGQPGAWPSWFDDVLLGSLLLYAAWLTGRNPRDGQRYLTGAWGVTCGMAYGSFFFQLRHLTERDPAPIPSTWVVAIKGVGLLLAICGLVASLKAVPEK